MRENAENHGHEDDCRDLRRERGECRLLQGDQHEDDRREAARSEPAKKQHGTASQLRANKRNRYRKHANNRQTENRVEEDRPVKGSQQRSCDNADEEENR